VNHRDLRAGPELLSLGFEATGPATCSAVNSRQPPPSCSPTCAAPDPARITSLPTCSGLLRRLAAPAAAGTLLRLSDQGQTNMPSPVRCRSSAAFLRWPADHSSGVIRRTLLIQDESVTSYEVVIIVSGIHSWDLDLSGHPQTRITSRPALVHYFVAVTCSLRRLPGQQARLGPKQEPVSRIFREHGYGSEIAD